MQLEKKNNDDYKIDIKGWSELNVFVSFEKRKWPLNPGRLTFGFQSESSFFFFVLFFFVCFFLLLLFFVFCFLIGRRELRVRNEECIKKKKFLFAEWAASGQNCEEVIYAPFVDQTHIRTKTQTGRKTLAVSKLLLPLLIIWLFWPHVFNIPDILATCIKYTRYFGHMY